MKKVAIAVVAVLCMVCLFGCIRSTGHFVVQMCISNQTSDSFSMSYDKFNGEKTYSFSADEDAELGIKFVTDSGELSCVVTDKAGNEYYRNDNVQTEDLTVKLGGKGKYFVKFKANDHSGSFEVKIG